VRRGALGLVAAFALALAGASEAHEVRPGYLELRQRGPELFDALWKVPARGGVPLALSLALPERCIEPTPRYRIVSEAAVVERWRVVCSGGLGGARLAVDGLAATLTDVLVRIEAQDGTTRVGRLTARAPGWVVEPEPGRAEVAATYLRLGIEHILEGIDHLFFVLALVLLVPEPKRLVATVTAFTAAHSLTLAAATLGVLRVAQAPVEAVIALSIVFVASEIAHGARGHPGLASRRPWVVAFVFGLLHGLGFAGALREVGLPSGAIPLALLFFNLGVEVGQLLFVACMLPLAGLRRRAVRHWPRAALEAPAYAIGGVAAWWTLERIAALL
jgi:hydrogenase/urease accessory protein HupE